MRILQLPNPNNKLIHGILLLMVERNIRKFPLPRLRIHGDRPPKHESIPFNLQSLNSPRITIILLHIRLGIYSSLTILQLIPTMGIKPVYPIFI